MPFVSCFLLVCANPLPLLAKGQEVRSSLMIFPLFLSAGWCICFWDCVSLPHVLNSAVECLLVQLALVLRATHLQSHPYFPTKFCLFSSKQGFQLRKRTRILYFSHGWHMAHTILIKYYFSFLSIFLCTCASTWWIRRYKKQVFLNRKIIKVSSNAICCSVCMQVFDLIMLTGGDIGQSEWRLLMFFPFYIFNQHAFFLVWFWVLLNNINAK